MYREAKTTTRYGVKGLWGGIFANKALALGLRGERCNEVGYAVEMPLKCTGKYPGVISLIWYS